MNIISLPRGQGKTTLLIKMSAETGIPIVTIGNKKYILDKAKEMNLKIPEPIIYNKDNIKDYKEIYVDEIDSFLYSILGCNVNTATITETKECVENPNNTLVTLFANSLNDLVIKYKQAIIKGDMGGGLNILKNIEMIVKIIKDIQENKELSTILDDLSSVWETVENKDEIFKVL